MAKFDNEQRLSIFPIKRFDSSYNDVISKNKGVLPLSSITTDKRSFRFGLDHRKGLQMSDTISLAVDVRLPEDITIEDLQDAINQARRYAGSSDSVRANVRNTLEINGIPFGGLSCISNGVSIIEVSVATAESSASRPTRTPETTEPGTAGQQLWAVVFEEALHNARKLTGQFDPNGQGYFGVHDVNELTEENSRKYLDQPEERIIEEALNSGILQARFGSSARYVDHLVVHFHHRDLPSIPDSSSPRSSFNSDVSNIDKGRSIFKPTNSTEFNRQQIGIGGFDYSFNSRLGKNTSRSTYEPSPSKIKQGRIK